MTPERASLILPLLRIQSYISSATHEPKQPIVDFDLNQFRLTLPKFGPHENLAHLHLRHFKLGLHECDNQWLYVDRPVPIGKPVIISRTLRYPGDHDWRKIVQFYGDKIAFIGLPAEHETFCQMFGKVDYFPTENLLQVARVLAGCELFITNQNACHAIGEGLKINILQEPCPSCRVAIFERPNAWYKMFEKLPRLSDGVPTGLNRLNLTFRSPIDGFSGIGQSAAQFMTRLSRRGHGITCLPTRESDFCGKADAGLQELRGFAKPGSKTLVYETTGQLEKNIKDGDTAMTLWESDRWPAVDVNALNRCDQVLVTCRWNAQTLAVSGCNRPIKVIPLGIDPDIFYPTGRTPDYCTFGAAGRVAGAGGRKGIDLVISAFKRAFPWQKDVRLRVKVFSDCPVRDQNDDRIIINRDYMTIDQIAAWHRGNSAFISASSGEGWGLLLHEAMACGSAPMACRYGGQAEFFDSQVGYEIPFKVEPAVGSATFSGHGNWASPSVDGLIYLMRRVYIKRDEMFDYGRLAAIRAAQFSWDNAVHKLEEALSS